MKTTKLDFYLLFVILLLWRTDWQRSAENLNLAWMLDEDWQRFTENLNLARILDEEIASAKDTTSTFIPYTRVAWFSFQFGQYSTIYSIGLDMKGSQDSVKRVPNLNWNLIRMQDQVDCKKFSGKLFIFQSTSPHALRTLESKKVSMSMPCACIWRMSFKASWQNSFFV